MNDLDLSELQVIVFESPYDCLHDPEAQDLFGKLMALKVKGYSKIHGENPLPFATCDFIGSHIIVCSRKNPFQNIYMTYKSISLHQCQRFNLEFPFLSILQKAKNETCHKEMSRIVQDCITRKENISYDTGWTIHPSVRNNPELQTVLKEIITTFAIHQHKDYGISHWVTFGICKVKTDQYFLKMGLEEISSEPLIAHPYLGYESARAVIAKNNSYSFYTHQTSKKYISLWDARTIIAPATQTEKKAA